MPADNPFVGRAGARPEIWMYGLRNPWRFSFDRETGDMWIGDVGQNAYEEIDFARGRNRRGQSTGVEPARGTHQYRGRRRPARRDPIFEYSHRRRQLRRHRRLRLPRRRDPGARGAYVFADYCVGALTRSCNATVPSRTRRSSAPRPASSTSFGEDAAGELYVLSRSGSIFRIDPA